MKITARNRRQWSLLRIGALVCIVALLVATAAPAGTIRDDRLDSLYTSFADSLEYSCVGGFQWKESGNSCLASGVLINNQWVLTAAHVVQGINSSNIDTMTFEVDGTTYHASETYYHSDWDGVSGHGNDIGLVRLDSAVSGVLPAYLYAGTDEQYAIGTIVGYGKTGTGLTGATQAAGTKRAGTNVIGLGSALNNISWTGGGTDDMLAADFDAPGATGDPTTNLAVATDLEYCAASGDSGGGWFIEADGDTYVAGVMSFLCRNPINSAIAMYGDIFGATRVSSYLDWISLFTTYLVSIVGDSNRDMRVDAGDLAIMGGNWMTSVSDGKPAGDLNQDGVVDGGDLALLGGNWGYGMGGMSVPEPSVGVVLAGGTVAVVTYRRRRRR